ncbi:ArsR/SmtB family transcription factor [Friedmanniella luteola]|uniref:ArsR/SmtB family transcription factor n=1 Tax=Friedmanniella luteola TaxID=546871 RepID=UPI000B85B0F5|nr:metalloregulator ArsR/SmtB family transcription factor [Friedmanniella luteola]
MNPFEVLADPVRRRLLELLTAGAQTAGALTDAVGTEFGITRPAASQHLRVLRESGLVTVQPLGTRRVYTVRTAPLDEVGRWLAQFAGDLGRGLDALETELARGRRERRTTTTPQQSPSPARKDTA